MEELFRNGATVVRPSERETQTYSQTPTRSGQSRINQRKLNRLHGDDPARFGALMRAKTVKERRKKIEEAEKAFLAARKKQRRKKCRR